VVLVGVVSISIAFLLPPSLRDLVAWPALVGAIALRRRFPALLLTMSFVALMVQLQAFGDRVMPFSTELDLDGLYQHPETWMEGPIAELQDPLRRVRTDARLGGFSTITGPILGLSVVGGNWITPKRLIDFEAATLGVPPRPTMVIWNLDERHPGYPWLRAL